MHMIYMRLHVAPSHDERLHAECCRNTMEIDIYPSNIDIVIKLYDIQ